MRTLKTTTISILALGLLGGSALGVAAQEEAADSLVTEEIAPGVERVIRDGAGHDLGQKHPSYRYDMDGIVVTQDGTVWLATSYSRSDNNANPDGPLVWALGEPGVFSVADGIPEDGPTWLVALIDGTLLVIADRVTRFDGEAFVPDDGPMFRSLRNGRFLWLIERDDLMGIAPEGETGVAPSAVLPAIWNGWTWTTPLEFGRYADLIGNDCLTDGVGITCHRPFGEPVRYLEGTEIRQIAAARDGTLWAIGGYDGDNGGLYRIKPQ